MPSNKLTQQSNSSPFKADFSCPLLELYGAKQSQALDHAAIEAHQISSFLLMKRAASFSWQTILDKYPTLQKLIVLCGTGNNGGDGFMVAQYARLAGKDVSVYLLGEEAKLQKDARRAFAEWQDLGETTRPLKTFPEEYLQTANNLDQPTIIVDAIFGTGLDRPVTGEVAKLFDRINQSQMTVCAIDIASGLNADTGEEMGKALRASITTTFITHKFGFYSNQGQDLSGEIFFSDLGLKLEAPEIYRTQTPLACSHNLNHWRSFYPKRLLSSHKGTTGTVLLMGGNLSMMGAIQMAAGAALKSGCGLCKLITPKPHHANITANQPEIMCFSESAFIELIQNTSAIAIGPGLGKDSWARGLWQQLTQSRNETPLVMDADALNLLAENPCLPEKGNCVFTPHPGEAARLLNCPIEAIQKDRLNAIRKLQKNFGGVFVLKGNGTLIFDGTRMELCRAGNPGMAVGGMGDVLTGTIVSLLAQGMQPFEAACLGVHLHAEAGDLCAKQNGQTGVLPSELSRFYGLLLQN